MRSFGSLHEASILSVLLLSKEIGHYLVAISPPSALVARPMAAVIGFLPCDRSVAARPELPTDVGHETKGGPSSLAGHHAAAPFPVRAAGHRLLQ